MEFCILENSVDVCNKMFENGQGRCTEGKYH